MFILFYFNSDFLIILASLDGGLGRLIVDSGASETVLDESVLIQLGFKLQDHATAKTIIGQGIEVPMKVLSGKQITLGCVLISDEFL